MSFSPLPPPSAAAQAQLEALLGRCVELGASDLHLTAGEPAQVRCQGALTSLGEEVLTPSETALLASAACDDAQRAAFAEQGSIDLALSDAEGGRFRVNAFRERGQVALAIRRLDDRIKSLSELHLPPQLTELCDLEEGLILFVGPTGSGKSTSLATLIDGINRSRAVHILTLEDPIEYLHRSRRSLVRQRQFRSDFTSFASALRAALREDPDVILVGEMRDRETLRAALTAAETGHLVFSTLHAASAVSASERFVGAFADHERDSVRNQLSYVLRAVVAQRLLRSTKGQRVPAVEVLRVTSAVANLIRTGRPSQVASALESGSRQGMQTFAESLASLVRRGLISEEAALSTSITPARLREVLRAQVTKAAGWQ